MARKPRLFVPGATYHVYCRVARGEFVFDDPYEAEEFVERVREVRDADDWRILAWCLMGNHYHLVIKTGSIPCLWVPPITTLTMIDTSCMGATFTIAPLLPCMHTWVPRSHLHICSWIQP